MERYKYRFDVLNSRHVATRDFERECDNEEHAESLRKNFEVEFGFPVAITLIGTVQSNRTGGAFVSETTKPEVIQASETPFVFDLEKNRTVPQTDAPDDTKTFPKNWHRKKTYVSDSGRVYYFGVEQPELRGTVTVSA